MNSDETALPVLLDASVASVVLSVPRESAYFSFDSGAVRAVEKALDDSGFPKNPRRRWWAGCPYQGGPLCDLYGGIRIGPARPSCRYCRGNGFCLRQMAGTVEDLASVALLGAGRVRWAEEVLAPRIAADLGIDLHHVVWHPVSNRDAMWYPPYGELCRQWVYPLDAGADGSVVLGIRTVDEAKARSAAPRLDELEPLCRRVA